MNTFLHVISVTLQEFEINTRVDNSPLEKINAPNSAAVVMPS